MIKVSNSHRTSARFLLKGLVQGQGVRPGIARIAAHQSIEGSVCNSSRGAEIVAIADRSGISRFEESLRTAFPHANLIREHQQVCISEQLDGFCIVSSKVDEELRTIIPQDLAICAECLDEVRSASDWRNGYPFASCAHCGPRYSVLNAMPFDRSTTTMDAFPMCPRCIAEYCDPSDRRFHAQTICCSECGPQCWATDREGNKLATMERAIQWVAKRIRLGDVAAIKGIGGYQMICDASDDEAVAKLRVRKARPSKPLPVMVANMIAAKQIAVIDSNESKALCCPENPIVLLRAAGSDAISQRVSPNLSTIGVLLPTSAMHAMLVDAVGRPLVVTSGNLHGSPLIYKNEVAASELSSVADVFLHHNRDIARPVDDSVVQCVRGKQMTIRAGRGIAPISFESPSEVSMLAVGGHQKVATAIQTKHSIILSPYIGDMDTETSRVRFIESVDPLQTLCQTRAPSVAHDRHPDYFTSNWANESSRSTSAVQHHHAHVVAGMLDHDLLESRAIGISFDGTGYGDDDSIWGGEALLATRSSFQRVGHLRPFQLPGGEHAIKHPSRIAQSLHSQLKPCDNPTAQIAIRRGPLTTSMGRLFDAVASIVLGIETADYEGEAAMRLESACDLTTTDSYEFAITMDTPAQFDWRPVLSGVENDIRTSTPNRIAMKFHWAVAKLVLRIAGHYADIPCVLSGGVFQNRVLLECIASLSESTSLDIRMPGRIPVNDGGLAVGQLLVATSGAPPCA